jgi:hypothetical protein
MSFPAITQKPIRFTSLEEQAGWSKADICKEQLVPGGTTPQCARSSLALVSLKVSSSHVLTCIPVYETSIDSND